MSTNHESETLDPDGPKLKAGGESGTLDHDGPKLKADGGTGTLDHGGPKLEADGESGTSDHGGLKLNAWEDVEMGNKEKPFGAGIEERLQIRSSCRKQAAVVFVMKRGKE